MRAPQPRSEPFHEPAALSAPRSETILVVDDDAPERLRLVKMLAKAGYHVLEAANGQEAIRLVHRIRPDLILMDVVMPDRNGYQVCAELKNDERSYDIPIMLFSGLSAVADKVQGFEAGAVDYITKPFHDGEVLARLRNHMKMQLLTRQLLDVNRSLLEKQAKLDEDLQAAVIIQQTLIPQELPAVSELDIAWRFLPSEWVGGDVFHVFQLDDRNVGLYVADVSGHGVPAAMVTVFISHSLSPEGELLVERGKIRRAESHARPPGEVLRALDNEYPFERFHKHFTICYALLDRETGELRYSSAGHPMPVLLRKDGAVEFLDKGGTIIGLGASMPFEEGTAKMCAGDRLFLYSDGVVDHSKTSGERYGEGRFIEVLRATQSEPVERVCERVIESLMDFGGRRAAQDDVTLLAVEFQSETTS